MELYKKIERNGVILKIYYDESCPDPREWDNLGTMVCWHRRYNLGDKHNYRDPDDFWTSLAEEITGDPDRVERMSLEQREKIVRENAVVLPLYLYDHGGLTMNTTGFSCPWDSGQVGWIYVTKKKIREEYGVKRVTKKLCDHVLSVLKNEVKEYAQWLEGDVYGFVVEDNKGNELYSSFGFFGTNWKKNGMASEIPAEYRFLLDEAA
jgi:hypothetical protein